MPNTEPLGDYWDRRGKQSYYYKGERHYTLTPVPLYARRRYFLHELVKPYIATSDSGRVCDYGCGDGWHLARLYETNPLASWFGFDISSEMVGLARQAQPKASIALSEGGIPFHERFDLIYVFAVLAHVQEDGDLTFIFQDIWDHLNEGGILLVFEQTGPRRKHGETWVRRTPEAYYDIAKAAGFVRVNQLTLSFPIFRFYERTILWAARRFCRGRTIVDRCINANQSTIINKTSELILRFGGAKLSVNADTTPIGNTLFAFRRLAGCHGTCPTYPRGPR